MAPRKRRATANATSAFMRNATTTWATTATSNTSTSTKGSSGKKSPFGFERFRRDEFIDLSSGFTPLDTFDTYFDSQITDLFQRQLNTAWMSYARERQTHYKDACGQPQYQDIRKSKMEGYFGQGFPAFDEELFDSGDLLAENSDREFKGFKVKHEYLNCPTRAWHSAKVVQTREKVSFFWFHVGVVPPNSKPSISFPCAPTSTKNAFGTTPSSTSASTSPSSVSYTSGSSPASRALFVACSCLSHGSLASAVITWRNSLVFHDTIRLRLFLYVYLPFVFTVINGGIYFSWQLLYWKFVLIDCREKIESGQRTTSFSFLLNNQRGIIGRSLSAIPPQSRIAAFMGGQLVYMVLTELPAVFLLAFRWPTSLRILKRPNLLLLSLLSKLNYFLLMSLWCHLDKLFNAYPLFIVKDRPKPHGLYKPIIVCRLQKVMACKFVSNEFRNQMYTDDDNNWWSTDGPPVIFVFNYSPHNPSSSSKHLLHSQPMSTQSQATPERNRSSGPAPRTNKKPTRRGGKTQKILADIPGPFPIRDSLYPYTWTPEKLVG
ncbi:hypothetical protein D9758_016941 [Tetrapyrgos nigripes]|uniref:Glycerophosphocholine acyltransferase 1 n=1 Tax=Tetrapyrgos nigripes TaxID=182062 RepID=A0A8H5BZH0_9AGAR|nr:hypothetical protein D9758_016941 [Tetrapyrgos nigripes]